jgi:Cu+-exporting ATPase
MSPHDDFKRIGSTHSAKQPLRPYLRVLLQVAGIHCPSCVEHINRLLSTTDLSVKLDNASVSYIDHTVLFHLSLLHPSSGDALDEAEVQNTLKQVVVALKEEGYQPNAIECKAIRDRNQTTSGIIQDHHGKTYIPFDVNETDQLPHLESQDQKQGKVKQVSLWDRIIHPQQSARLIEAELERQKRWQRHLQACRICREGDDDGVSKEQEQSSSSESTSSGGKVRPKVKEWKVTYCIGGMTCASCVSNVEKTVQSLESKPVSFGVALMQGSAVATIRSIDREEALKRAKEICEAIDDSGYDCEIEEVREQDQMASGSNEQRTVRIRVDGMFCSHCIAKVKGYLLDNPSIDVDEVTLDTLTLTSPVVVIKYTPSKTTNIRTILSSIDALDPAFTSSMAIPPSISSRSAQLAKKELYSLLTRLIFAFLFVPPTLVVAVIVPTFLSQAHPLRVSLSDQVVGQANKGDFILWALATPVQFIVGYVFYKRAFKSLRSVWRDGRSWSDRLVSWGDMNVLVALGTSVAYFASLAFLIVDATRKKNPEANESSMLYFDACVFLIFFILFGRVLEAWSKRKTSSAVSALGSLRPTQGLLLEQPDLLSSSAVKSLQVELLEVGDLVLIPSGSSPPLDSLFVSTSNTESASFLESAISGESKSVIKKNGDQLYAGTVNQSKSAIIARVNALAGSNLIDNVIEIVQSSSSRKAEIEQLADKVTSHFVPLIVFLAIIVLAIWVSVLYSPGVVSDQWRQKHIQNYQQSGSQFLYALQFAVSVLVVACPCGIGLAAPTAQIIAIGLASKHGILVQGGGQAFQTAVQLSRRRKDNAFVFDKTGTITRGIDGSVKAFHIGKLPEKWTKEALCKVMWLIEGNSGHPVASGIRAWCEAQTMQSSEIQVNEVEEVAGRGLKAVASIDNSKMTVLIGSLALIKNQYPNASMSESMQIDVKKWQSEGASVVFVAIQSIDEENDRIIMAALSIADVIREEAASTIAWLRREYNGQVWMVSGDTVNTAKAIASQVGIAESNVVAGVLPAEKAEWVERIKLSSRGDPESTSSKDCKVAFIGDGINDAPALSSADLSIALGSGSSLATSTASFILLNTDRPLASIPTILSLSRATEFKIWQNLAWACAFNVIFIPIAAGAFVQKGFTFGPSWSGLAMALSSVSVVLNALTLRLWRPPKISS